MSARAPRRAVGAAGNPKPGGLCLNRKDLRSVREIALDHYDAVYVYLRENQLTGFDVDIKLDHLRVLDLSINDIEGAVDFLSQTPHLRHLYMTGNKIETLMGICNFAPLETLCLSDNVISSFDGLENLPSLRVLSLNFNNIASFQAYPTLPSLHTLNLVGNPITELPSYRNMAIAINAPGLVSIDGTPILPEERAAVEYYQGKIVYCIKEGFTIEGDNEEEAADVFLLKLQRQREASKVLQLSAIRLAALAGEEGSRVLTEGVPVGLSLCMQDMRSYQQRTTAIFHSSHLYPVVFKVSGEATEVFVVGSMNHWADPIELERCEEDGEIYFHTTLYLPTGDYEYRYIVDGVEKVSETNRITSKYKQGFCNLYQVTKLEPQEEEQQTILHIRWMRNSPGGPFELIENENSLVYTPATADIGCCLRAEVLAYIDGEFSFLYFDISSPIVAAPPSCPHLEIKGTATEGAVLMAQADYVGGVEGNSSLVWYRVYPSGEEVVIQLRDPWAGYKLTNEDIGSRIRVEFTPVRNDWVAGVPQSVMTEPVAAGQPECESIKIIGSLVEGSQLEVDVVYSGGEEGASYYQWLRKADDGSEQYIPIPGENSTKYVPCAEDVGKCLAVEYTPLNAAGVEGETCRCVLENPIEPAAPEVHHLAIVGTLKEQHVLTLEYDYSGGHFGTHVVQWYRHHPRRHLMKVGHPGSQALALTAKEVGCSIEVSMTPVRSDGVRGKAVHVKADGVVAAAEPEIRLLNIIGTPAVGNKLSLRVEYVGGTEGNSSVEWFVEDPQTQAFVQVASGASSYLVRPEDHGRTVKVTYTPVRADGVHGEAKSRLVQIKDETPADNAAPASAHHTDPAAGATLAEAAPKTPDAKASLPTSTKPEPTAATAAELEAPAAETARTEVHDASEVPTAEEPQTAEHEAPVVETTTKELTEMQRAPEPPAAAETPKDMNDAAAAAEAPATQSPPPAAHGNIHIDLEKKHDSDADSSMSEM